jgi:hypothetical protein
MESAWMSVLERYLSSLRSVRDFLAALVVQMAIAMLLAPWNAPTETEFYAGSRRALLVSLLAHVVVRLALPLVRPPKAALAAGEVGEPNGGPKRWGAGSLLSLALVAAMLIALVFAMALDNAFLGEAVATFFCVTAQQLAFATVVFHIQERARAGRSRGRTWPSLTVACLLALYFSLVIPSLFRQIATGTGVQNDPGNLVFAIPVILIALFGSLRFRFYRN